MVLCKLFFTENSVKKISLYRHVYLQKKHSGKFCGSTHTEWLEFQTLLISLEFLTFANIIQVIPIFLVYWSIHISDVQTTKNLF